MLKIVDKSNRITWKNPVRVLLTNDSVDLRFQQGIICDLELSVLN